MNAPESPKRDPSKRPERQQSSNWLWYLMIGLVLSLVIFSLGKQAEKGQELTFSEFYRGLEQGRFDATNVFELTFRSGYITFQDQPQPETGQPPPTTRHYQIPAENLPDPVLENLIQLLEEKGIAYGFDRPPSEWQSLLYLLFVPMLFLLVLIFLLRRVGGAGTAMSFGRSRGKLYAQEDVGGPVNGRLEDKQLVAADAPVPVGDGPRL
ncbi:MAG TPA: hypothetical protein EYP56_03455, partial [Planctomycetaceae bacterium]|nr:hypothetical protein [Planctomycetaceae bacterium]